MKIMYLFWATVFLFVIIAGAFMLVDMVELYTLSNRAEKQMRAAAWAGFSELDLDVLAKRHVITNEENRDIYLDKVKAETKIRQYIKDNFKLDDAYKAKADSFIPVKSHPVTIDTLKIYNPNDLATAPLINGKSLTNTTVHVKFCIPLEIVFAGKVYKEIQVVVDTKTFYSDAQR